MAEATGTTIFKGTLIKTKEKLAKKIAEKSDLIESLISEALEKDLDETAFRTKAKQVLKEYYEKKGLFRKTITKTDEELEEEIDKAYKSYTTRKSLGDSTVEEDRNRIAELQKQMDIILGIYNPMLTEIEKDSTKVKESLDARFADLEKVSVDVFKTILTNGSSLNKTLKDFSDLISVDFKKIIEYEILDKEYYELTKSHYSNSPRKKYNEMIETMFNELATRLNALRMALNEKKEIIVEKGLYPYQVEDCEKIISSLLTKMRSILKNAGKTVDNDKIVEDARTLLDKMSFVEMAPETAEPDAGDEEPVEEEEEEIERRTFKEFLKDKLPFLFTKRDKKKRKQKKDEEEEPALSEDELAELIEKYKRKIAAYNAKVELFNKKNLEVKASGFISETDIKGIYRIISDGTTLPSLQKLSEEETELKNIKRELDSLEIDIIGDRIDYLNSTGHSITSIEALKDLKMNKPDEVLSSALDDFIAINDKYIVIAEKRIDILKAEKTAPGTTDARKAEIDEEIAKLEMYIISQKSIIQRGIVEACQRDRTLNINTILDDRRAKIATIREEVNRELGIISPDPSHGPDPSHDPDPADDPDKDKEEKVKEELRKLGIDTDKLDILKATVPDIYGLYEELLYNPVSPLKTNISKLKETGLLDLIYGQHTYLMIKDSTLSEKIAYLKVEAFPLEEIKSIFAKYNVECLSLSVENFKEHIRKYVIDEAPDLLLIELYDVTKIKGASRFNQLTFAKRYNTNKALVSQNLKILRELNIEDKLYEAPFTNYLFDPELKDKLEMLRSAGLSNEDIKKDWLENLGLSKSELEGKIKKLKPSPEEEHKIIKEALEKMGFDVAKLDGLQASLPDIYDLLRGANLTTLKNNLELLKAEGLESFIYEETSYKCIFDSLLKDKIDYLKSEKIEREYMKVFLGGYNKHLTGSLDEFKGKINENVQSILKDNILDKLGFDVNKTHYKTLGEKLSFSNIIYNHEGVFKQNIALLKGLGLGERVYEERLEKLLFDPQLAAKLTLLRDNEITDEEIVKDWLTRISLLTITALKDQIDELKPKKPTKEELIAALKESLKALGVNLSLLEGMGISNYYDTLLEVEVDVMKQNVQVLNDIDRSNIIYKSDSCFILIDTDLKDKIDFLKTNGLLEYKEYLEKYNLIYKESVEDFKARIKASILDNETIINLIAVGYDIRKTGGLSLGDIRKFTEECKNINIVKYNVELLRGLKINVYERRYTKILLDPNLGAKITLLRNYGLTIEVIKTEWLEKLDTMSVTDLHKTLSETEKVHLKEKQEDLHVSLSKLNFREGPQEVDREKATVEKAVPMLKIEVYKNGVRVRLLKQAKNQLKDLQVKVALVGKTKDGKVSKRAIPNTTQTLREGESIALTSADFDVDETGLKIISTYETEDEKNARNETTIGLHR